MFIPEVLGDVNPFVLFCLKNDTTESFPLDHVFGNRLVKAYELELIIWSEGGKQTIDGKEYDLHAGDLIFRKPGMVISGKCPFSFYTIIFCMVHSFTDFMVDPNNLPDESYVFFDEVCKKHYKIYLSENKIEFPFKFPTIMNVANLNEYKDLFDHISKEYTLDRPQTRFITKAYLMQIFVLMFNDLLVNNWNKHPNRSIRVNYQKILKVKNYIDENLKLRFSLDELAAIAKLSPNFFSRIFKEIVGQSPVDYINRSKINAMKNILISTNMEIKDIALEYGFENETYFYRLFKKYHGSTPSLYRNQNQSDLILLLNLDRS